MVGSGEGNVSGGDHLDVRSSTIAVRGSAFQLLTEPGRRDVPCIDKLNADD
jgi:hypothetical protein